MPKANPASTARSAALPIPLLRLQRQRLIGAKCASPDEAVRALVAVQSQDFAGAKWALGARTASATESIVDDAFNRGAILRTHLMRPTWHFVDAADIRWLLALTAPRVHAGNAYMYRKTGLDDETFRRSRATMVRVLQGGHARTRDELRLALEEDGIATEGDQRMTCIMMHAELEALVCSGPRRGKQFTYALLEERVPPARALDREEALATLALRYFTSRGPATVQDFAKWSGLTIVECKRGLEAVKRELMSESVDGRMFWFTPNDRAIAVDAPIVHLLSIYDEYVSGYKDRSDIVSPAFSKRLTAMDAALTSIIVIDGLVVGTWRRTFESGGARVGTELFRPLSRPERGALDAAVVSFSAFLEMPVRLG